MDNKREQERAELYRTIWNIANDLRGMLSAWYWCHGCKPWFYWVCWITSKLSTQPKGPKYVHGNKSTGDFTGKNLA